MKKNKLLAIHGKTVFGSVLPFSNIPLLVLWIDEGLNYIHAEVLDHNSGLSKWLPESIFAMWDSQNRGNRTTDDLAHFKTPERLCQMIVVLFLKHMNN